MDLYEKEKGLYEAAKLRVYLDDDLYGDIGYLPLAPNLAVEVTSPNDRPAEVREKADHWLETGVEVVLVVDPRAKTVEWRSASETRTVNSGVLDLDSVLPGFGLDVDDLFV